MTTTARQPSAKLRDKESAKDGAFAAQMASALAAAGVNGTFDSYHQAYQQLCGADVRRARGVYCTPQPLAGYMIRSVDYLLREEEKGLGVFCVKHPAGRNGKRLPTPFPPPRVRIVDPACGSGVFLSELVRVLRDQFMRQGDSSGWRSFVRYELPQLAFGFDVLPEAQGAASLLLRHQLAARDLPAARQAEWSCGEVEHPLPIRVGNPLDGDSHIARWTLGDESQPPLLVVIGNPPYANFGRHNRTPWILEQLKEYKQGLGEKKLNLNDDFIKFFRWGQYWIDRAGGGVLALVTSNTYLAGLTHRRMRESLLSSFDDIYILDLHGDAARRKGDRRDENVFGVRQGVAIGLFVKARRDGNEHRPTGRVYHAELRGTREEKLAALADSHIGQTAWRTLSPLAENFYFAPQPRAASEYAGFPRLCDIFQEYVSGVQTKNDNLFVGFTREEVANCVQTWLDEEKGSGVFCAKHPAGRNGKRLPTPFPASPSAAQVEFDPTLLRPYLVAPFDRRWIYYDPQRLGRARFSVMRHMLGANVALVFMRQSTTAGEYDHFLAVDSLVSDRCFYSPHGAPYLAPLYLYDDDARRPNLRGGFLDEAAARLQRKQIDAQDVFHYMLAVFHSRTFRERYAAELRTDFPHLPLTSDATLFDRLQQLGKELTTLQVSASNGALPGAVSLPASVCRAHDSSRVGKPPVPRRADGDNKVARGYPKFESSTSHLFINRQQFLPGIQADDWSMRVGGYAVLSRWLSRRRGRELDPADTETFQHIVRTLRHMRAIMRRIDEAIPRWPLP